MRKLALPLLLILLMLFAFTACDDDDNSTASTEEDDDNSRACTEEDLEIICAIIDGCDEVINSDDNITASFSDSGTTGTFTVKDDYTCTATTSSIIDGSDISVTIKSGSTIEADGTYSDFPVYTYDIDATVDGTSRSLYLKSTRTNITYTATGTSVYITSTIKLDGVELTGFDDTCLSEHLNGDPLRYASQM